MSTHECRQRLAEIETKICQEDGPGTACEYIERYLARLGLDGQHPALDRRARATGEKG